MSRATASSVSIVVLEALDLRERGLDLERRRRAARAPRARCRSAGERRAQLVRGVGAERALADEQLVEPFRGRVERRGDRVELADARARRARREVALAEPRAAATRGARAGARAGGRARAPRARRAQDHRARRAASSRATPGGRARRAPRRRRARRARRRRPARRRAAGRRRSAARRRAVGRPAAAQRGADDRVGAAAGPRAGDPAPGAVVDGERRAARGSSTGRRASRRGRSRASPRSCRAAGAAAPRRGSVRSSTMASGTANSTTASGGDAGDRQDEPAPHATRSGSRRRAAS